MTARELKSRLPTAILAIIPPWTPATKVSSDTSNSFARGTNAAPRRGPIAVSESVSLGTIQLQKHVQSTPTSNTAASPGVCDGEKFFLPPGPVVGVIRRVGWLRDEHDPACGIVLQDADIDAWDIYILTANLVQGSGARNMLQLSVLENSQRHWV